MNKMTPSVTCARTGRKAFLSLFSETARYHHRRDVFRDFVTLSAIALHNGIYRDPQREEEYMQVMSRYEGADPDRMARLLALTVEALQAGPSDFLGPIFMDLSFGDAARGQFYTPEGIAKLITEIGFGDVDAALAKKPFLSVSEPSCGAGGMILPIVETMLRQGHDPACKLWVQAVDVDRTSALMCYIQLSLWNVPAEIIVGNTLTLEVREIWKTPSYALFGWQHRLARHGMREGFPQTG